ncbi:MAG: hypothetical protein K5697_04830 [Lachnospiraceae bacterium]|nr:hypothetical protein [Lachnospiraceae bacterium]
MINKFCFLVVMCLSYHISKNCQYFFTHFFIFFKLLSSMLPNAIPTAFFRFPGITGLFSFTVSVAFRPAKAASPTDGKPADHNTGFTGGAQAC